MSARLSELAPRGDGSSGNRLTVIDVTKPTNGAEATAQVDHGRKFSKHAIEWAAEADKARERFYEFVRSQSVTPASSTSSLETDR